MQGQRLAPQQRYQQHNQQLDSAAGVDEAALDNADAPTAGEEKEPEDGTEEGEEGEEGGETVQYTDAYRPSYNAGPHFYLPVLRYMRNGKDDDEAEEDDKAENAHSGSTKRLTARERVTAAEKQTERQNLAADEDFTTDGRDDTPTFDPATTLPPPAPTASTAGALAPESSSTTSGGDSSKELVLQPMRWGLIPQWTSAPNLAAADAAQSYNMINARAESVDQAKTYRHLLKRRRCVVVVDSYYEWHTQTINGRTKKQPFSFIPNHPTPPITDPNPAPDAAPIKPLPVSAYDRTSASKPFFLLAALYDTWTDPSLPSASPPLYSVTVLTTSAAQKLGWCHERQPVILTRAGALRWMDCRGVAWGDELRTMVCRPWSDGVTWYKVPEVVGSVRNQVSECTQPLEDYLAAKKAAGIGKFFGAAPTTTPGKTAGGEEDEAASTKTTATKRGDEQLDEEVVVKVPPPSAIEATSIGAHQSESGVVDSEHAAQPMKRERERDSTSAMLRTPEKKLKVEGGGSRAVSPASAGFAVKKEEVSRSQMALTSFFNKA